MAHTTEPPQSWPTRVTCGIHWEEPLLLMSYQWERDNLSDKRWDDHLSAPLRRSNVSLLTILSKNVTKSCEKLQKQYAFIGIKHNNLWKHEILTSQEVSSCILIWHFLIYWTDDTIFICVRLMRRMQVRTLQICSWEYSSMSVDGKTIDYCETNVYNVPNKGNIKTGRADINNRTWRFSWLIMNLADQTFVWEVSSSVVVTL